MLLRSVILNQLKVRIQSLLCTRFYANEAPGGITPKRGVVVGVYDNLDFTKAAEKIDNESGGKVKDLLNKFQLKLGETEVFHCIAGYYAIAVVGLGPKDPPFNEVENLNEFKENVRIAAARGCRKLQKLLVDRIEVETFSCAEAAAEGANLAVWKFQDLKNKATRDTHSKIFPFEETDLDLWNRGTEKAKAQNLARMLTQCPSNIMTPTHFVQCAIDELCPVGIQVEARDYDWMQNTKMFSFLTMAQGSCEPPLLLEMAYCGGSPDNKPVLMVGKGVTFDSGGLCLNPSCKKLQEYSADMAGAAVIVGVFKALSALKIPINCNAIIPLCENMPGGNAPLPGLIVTALNGKTIRIDDTRHDGRIYLVDGLIYAERYKPSILMSIATLDDGMRMAMASGPTGVFTSSDLLWEDLRKAGADTGDRMWRLPLWRHYDAKVTAAKDADYTTVGKGKGGDPCSAAAFLKLFAPKGEFIHFDITGTGRISTGVSYPYLRKNLMTGRPVRTLVEFLSYLAAEGK